MSIPRQVLVILEINLKQEFTRAQAMAKELAETLGLENITTPIKFDKSMISQVGVCGSTDQSHADIFSVLSLTYASAQIEAGRMDHTLAYAAGAPVPAFRVSWG